MWIEQTNQNNQIEFKTEVWFTLTDKEKEVIKKHLKLIKDKQEVKTIVLTREELNEFRNLLKENPRDEQKLKEFVEKQEKETITTTEIMKWSQLVDKLWWIENFKEISDLFNETIYEHFFKNNKWPFNVLNISEDAKRNFSTWANFFFMDYLAQELQNTWTKEEFKEKIWELFWTDKKEGLLENINNLSELTDKIKGNISLFKDLFTWDLSKTLSQVYKPEKETLLKEVFAELKIEDYEKEAIFMNPLEAHNFMNFVYNENHNKEEIKNYISVRKENGKIEFSQEDRNKLKNIWEKMNTLISPEVGSALWKFSKIKQNFQKIWEWLKNQITKNKGAIEVLSVLTAIPILWDFIKSFLKFIWITDLDKLLAGKNFEASKKTISENIIWSWSIFEGKKVDKNTFMKIKWNNDNSFLNDINFLTWNKKWEDFWKWVLEFFKKGNEFWKFIENKKTKINLEWDSINYTELKKSVSLFKEYKIAKEKDKSLNIDDFVLKKEKAEEAQKEKINKINKSREIKQKNDSLKNDKKNLDEAINLLKEKNKDYLKEIWESKTPEERKKLNNERIALIKQIWKKTTEKVEIIKEIEKWNKIIENDRNNYIVKWPENLDISWKKIEGVFKIANKFYKINITNNWLFINWNKEIPIKYTWAEKIFNSLKEFNWRLDDKASRNDFESNVLINPKLNWHTIKDILMNWLYEKVMWKQQNQPWLKQLFKENFFENWKLKDKVSMTFWKQNYNFEKEKQT